MSTLRPFIRDFVHAAFVFLVVCAATHAIAADAPADIEPSFLPKVGQEGKDVMWVPTPQKAVDRTLEMARVGQDDFVIDLGSGDGRIVITAAKQFGASGFGVDLNPDMVKLSEHRARQFGVEGRAKFYVRDIFKTDLSRASVIATYLLPELNIRLRLQLLKLALGTRIVTHAFDMGEWEADETDTSTLSMLRLWIVPARVAGTWSGTFQHAGQNKPFEPEINQQFQRLSGLVRIGPLRTRLRDPKLRGDEISFVALDEQRTGTGVRYDFTGRVKGGATDGEVTASDGKERMKWTVKLRRTVYSPGA